MILALALFVVSLVLTALFSGVETGFYRVPRIRLLIDAVGGDRIARGLLWASNNPDAVVTTNLVGNNIVNYLSSASVVAMAAAMLPSSGLYGEVLLTLLSTPLVFLCGELLPKRAFLKAPYQLMRRTFWPTAVATVILAVPSFFLWLLCRALSRAAGASIEPLRMAVRRRELTEAFSEGHAMGILSTAQRELALATFALGSKPLRDFMIPAARQPRLTSRAQPEDVLHLARRRQIDAWPLESTKFDAATSRPSYVRASRLMTEHRVDATLPLEPLTLFNESTPFLQALTHLEASGEPMAAVVGPGARVVGYVYVEQLQQALWDSA